MWHLSAAMTGSASTAPAVAATHRESDLDGAAGLRIHSQEWLPGGEPRACVVLVHGASEHSGRYRYVVERLLPDGFSIHAVDHRGHGRSEGRRGYVDRFDHVVADLDGLVERTREQHPGRKVFMLGHSFGGCVATAYAVRHQEKLDGLALSAPLVVLEAAPALQRAIARTLSRLAPRTGVYSVDAGRISRDPAEVAAYVADPLNHHGKISARTVTEIAAAVASFPEALPRLTLPLLVMHGTGDRIVPDAGARLVHQRANSPDRALHLYEGFFHEIFNEPAGERDRPLDDLAAWLAARSA